MAHRTKDLEAETRLLSLDTTAVLGARTLGLEGTTLPYFDLRDTTPLGSWTYRLHLLVMAHRTKDLEAATRSLSKDLGDPTSSLGLEGTTLPYFDLRDTTLLGSWTYRLHLLVMAHRTNDLEAATRSLSKDLGAATSSLGLDETTLRVRGRWEMIHLVVTTC